ncbi:MAG: hypothetical protein LC098_04600 [Burkholderiales bacterium]|nr:hypothetical protein [Burkholderiales bacterium]
MIQFDVATLVQARGLRHRYDGCIIEPVTLDAGSPAPQRSDAMSCFSHRIRFCVGGASEHRTAVDRVGRMAGRPRDESPTGDVAFGHHEGRSTMTNRRQCLDIHDNLRNITSIHRSFAMHLKKLLSVTRGTALCAATLAAVSALATQTVEPTLTAGGASINGSTQTVPAGSTFTFYGMYSDDVASPESGLGLKVKYNGTHLTNVTVSEEYTKCRIAAADVQNPATATAQAVMGWIDTSIRPSGVVGSATGAVGWPNLADLTSGGCLNPGSINGAANAGDNAGTPAATAGSPLKLFKITGTMAAGCTSAGLCTSSVTLTSDGNYSYANGGSSGFANKSFTIQGAAAPSIALASSNPFVSRKTHGAAGTFDLSLDPAGSAATGQPVTVEPRQAQSGSHQIVIAFNTSVTGAQFPTVTAVAGATNLPVSTSFSGNEMTVTIGSTGTPVPNSSRVVVTATGAGSAAGLNPSVVVGFLVGDVTGGAGGAGNRSVQGGDVTYVQQRLLQAANALNFKADIDVNGTVQGGDVTRVQQRLLTTLP